MRGVARNRGIAEFLLDPWIRKEKVDDILAQLTPDERSKFRVRAGYCPSIELCPVGEWSMSVSSCSVCAVSVKSSVSCTREAASTSPVGCAGWVD